MCSRQVCEACATDWSTCEVPHGRELRLGMGARLRAVDAAGRIGLVSTWRGAYRVIDLHRGRWLEARELPSRRRPEAALTEDGRIVWAMFATVTEHGAQVERFLGFHEHALGAGADHHIGCDDVPVPDAIRLTRDGAAFSFARSQHVYIVERARGAARVLELPAYEQLIQAMAYDHANSALVVGSYGRVLVHQVRDTACKLVASWNISNADILWCGIASGRVAAVSVHGRELAVAAYAPWRPTTLHPPIYTWPPQGAPGRDGPGPYASRRPTRAALSPDGRLLALVGNVGGDHRVDVHNLDTGTIQSLSGHTDDVHLVEFTATGHELITGDYDNRVLIRPRVGDQLVEASLEVDVPGDAEPFPDLAVSG